MRPRAPDDDEERVYERCDEGLRAMVAVFDGLLWEGRTGGGEEAGMGGCRYARQPRSVFAFDEM